MKVTINEMARIESIENHCKKEAEIKLTKLAELKTLMIAVEGSKVNRIALNPKSGIIYINNSSIDLTLSNSDKIFEFIKDILKQEIPKIKSYIPELLDDD